MVGRKRKKNSSVIRMFILIVKLSGRYMYTKTTTECPYLIGFFGQLHNATLHDIVVLNKMLYQKRQRTFLSLL